MNRKAGQSLLDACIVMMVLCLVFFGLLQLSQLAAAKEVLDYAAGCGARARTVGFNAFMVRKVVRVAAIPNAGRLVEPAPDPRPVPGPLAAGSPGQAWDYALRAQPASAQYPVESARIPLYLGAEHEGRLSGILDYARWDTLRHTVYDLRGIGLGVHTAQETPLWAPLHRLWHEEDAIRLSGDAVIENHYPLYLGP